MKVRASRLGSSLAWRTSLRKAFWRTLLLTAVGLILAASINAQEPQQSAAPGKAAKSSHKKAPARPALEPKAIEILKAACERLGAAHSMAFTTIVMNENPSLLGPPLAYMTKSEVARPDKLRVITLADGPRSDFFYNGKTMMAYAPTEDLVAVAPAPPTIDATLKEACEKAAIYFPFSDVVVALQGPFRRAEDRLLYRPIQGDRRNHHGHGGLRQ